MPTDRAQDAEAIRAARVEAIRENVSHIARGCRASTGHNPAPYLNSIEAALVAWLADEAERDRLVARLEAAERERDEAHRGYLREIDAIAERYERRQEIAREALHMIAWDAPPGRSDIRHIARRALAALAAAAPGETTEPEPFPTMEDLQHYD